MATSSNVATVVVAGLLISGCAKLPTATVRYYLPTTEIHLEAVRSVGCDAIGNVVAVTSVDPKLVSKADTSKPYFFEIEKLNSKLADSDVKFDLTSDGRLKGLNTTSTGEGGAILKSAATVASAIAVTAAITPEDACVLWKKRSDGKPVAITYDGVLFADGDSGNSQLQIHLEPAISGDANHELFKSRIGELRAKVVEVSNRGVPPPISQRDKDKTSSNGSTELFINARQPALAHVVVFEVGGDFDGKTLWDDWLPVAQFGEKYVIPLGKPAMAGVVKTVLAFDDNGSLTSINYVANSGTDDVMDVANTVAAAAKNHVSDEAAALKAKADLIAQQQRLVACRISPKDCK